MESTNFTVGQIKKQLREKAPYIAGQYSALWPEMVTNELTGIERRNRERMSDQIFDLMHDYGMSQVRKHGLPSAA